MALDTTRLREDIVLLEVVDARRVGMDAAGYQAAARAVRQTIERELGNLPMQAFISDVLPSLEDTAQNIFFDGRRRFADLDGSGCARHAQKTADQLLRRVGRAGRPN
jgi:hypothetical protein